MAGYDPIADRYAKLVRQGWLKGLIEHLAQQLLALAGDVAGLKVLDAGCGEGHVARLFARHGADVTAVDISPRLLKLARTYDDGREYDIEYVEADLAGGLPSYRQSFDLVTANMVLDDCENHVGFLRTVRAALKPDGRFLMSFNNPYSVVPRGKFAEYFQSGAVGSFFGVEKAGFEIPYYYRTFEDCVTAFRQSGFLLRTLIDIGSDPADPNRPAEPVPSLLVLELVPR